ncbi:tyrosine-type recombinase/integrase [Actinomadura geliboluensis]|uniref:tyrosine-type recombinase/integrase n=1 Tax=Actinomadura geliboluensis TaxID=882440 RepID=UPI003723EB52
MRRAFRLVTRKAGIGESWSPRELRHSSVSIMSDGGVPVEAIADLCGHSSPAVTGQVYRHQLRPVIGRRRAGRRLGVRYGRVGVGRPVVAPFVAPHRLSRSKKGSGSRSEAPLSCCFFVGTAGFEPTTP